MYSVLKLYLELLPVSFLPKGRCLGDGSPLLIVSFSVRTNPTDPPLFTLQVNSSKFSFMRNRSLPSLNQESSSFGLVFHRLQFILALPYIVIVYASTRNADSDGVARTVSRPVPSGAGGARVLSLSSEGVA